MENKKSFRKSLIVLPILAAAALSAVAVGTTYAIFRSNKTVNNHLSVGNLKAGFYLTSAVNDVLNADGTISVDQSKDFSGYDGYEAGRGVDLAVYSGDVVACENFVPTMKGETCLSVYNNGSVAFDYEITLTNKKVTLEDGTSADDKFDEQITLTLTGSTDSVLKAGESAADIKISYVFEDREDNNNYQLATFSFDVTLSAVQVTANH